MPNESALNAALAKPPKISGAAKVFVDFVAYGFSPDQHLCIGTQEFTVCMASPRNFRSD